MTVFTEIYRRLYGAFGGKGFGFGIFNWIHRVFWRGLLQPAYVNVHGCRLYLPKHDEDLADHLRLENSWEPEVVAEFKARIRPGMVVADLGANVGYFTLLASQLVGSTGLVAAFEPEPGNLRLLSRNIHENGCANVLIYPYAVGESMGYADMHLSPMTPGRHSIAALPPRAGGTIRVVTVALDEFWSLEREPGFIKMDIEGGELSALKGMTRLLKSRELKTLIVECNSEVLSSLGMTRETVLSYLKQFDFHAKELDRDNVLCIRA